MKREGITLVEISIIVVILGILVMLAVPNFTSTADSVKADVCVTNLRQINLAKEQWALENNIEAGDTGSTPDADDLDSYIRSGTASLVCPMDLSEEPSFSTSYDINILSSNPTCKISSDHHL